MDLKRRVFLLKGVVWLLGLYPLARVGWWLRDGILGLGANPVEKVLHHTGWWTLVLLLVTLAVSPLRRLTGRNELVRLRRPLGLFAFFYATLHLGIYLGLDQLFGWQYILEDVAERPFITIGFGAWLLLVPLAVTSTRGWIRRLGKRWTWLHRLVYLAAAMGVIHFYWRVKADTRLPLVFAAVFLVLMAFRFRTWLAGWRQRRRVGDGRAAGPGRRKEGAGAGDRAGSAGAAAEAGGAARTGAGSG